MRFWVGIFLVAMFGVGAFKATTYIQAEHSNLLSAFREQGAGLRNDITAEGKKISDLSAAVSELRAEQKAEWKNITRANKWVPDLVGASVHVSTDHDKPGPVGPVSITRISEHQFLVANYRQIFVFDEAKSTLKKLPLEGNIPLWAPTAVFYSAFYDLVFIANYTGGDVVTAKLERQGDNISLKLVERITDSEGIKGPEGITISRGGRFMALADYLGNQVSLFERVNNTWKLRWRRPSPAAHGVAIVGGYVYAGGTSIAKFDIEDGAEVAKTSTLDDRPILFATCLHEDRTTGDLIGSDTMAGRVFVMSPNLEVKASFGANGPTFANFSMPYCAFRDGKATYVLSTYQNRIIKIEGGLTTSFEFAAPQWRYTTPIPNSADVWRGAAKYDSPTFQMFGKNVRPSYGSLQAADNTKLVLPNRLTIKRSPWLFYLVTIAQKDDWIAIVANSSPVALLYNQNSGALGSAQLNDWDCWAASEMIRCPSGERTLDDLVAGISAISEDPAPADAAKVIAESKGTTVPILDYWRAWKAATD